VTEDLAQCGKRTTLDAHELYVHDLQFREPACPAFSGLLSKPSADADSVLCTFAYTISGISTSALDNNFDGSARCRGTGACMPALSMQAST